MRRFPGGRRWHGSFLGLMAAIACGVLLLPSGTPFPHLTGSVLSPLVSIMMPTYNKGRYIVRAVLSALRQTLEDIELLISDDRSTDNTLHRLKPLLSSDSRIRYWRNPVRLYTHANRIRTVHAARAPFLLCLDSDDELMNGTAAVDRAAHLRSGADMVEHWAMQLDSTLHYRPWVFKPPPFAEADNETVVRAFWNGTMNWTLWLKMYRRGLYAAAIRFLGPEVAALRNVIGQDRLHLATMYRLLRKFITVDYCGYCYYRNVRENSWHRSTNQSRDLGVMEALLWRMAGRRITEAWAE
jgi:glycosyltransferase involved in cell wall biosynthesis